MPCLARCRFRFSLGEFFDLGGRFIRNGGTIKVEYQVAPEPQNRRSSSVFYLMNPQPGVATPQAMWESERVKRIQIEFESSRLQQPTLRYAE